MFKRKLTTGDLLLIIANLVPLYGVWFEGWDARMVFVVYCLETVIIGLVNVLKMAGVTLLVHPKSEWNSNGKISMVSGWFFIVFFVIHYGFFVFMQTQLFFGISTKGAGIGTNVYTEVPAMLGSQGILLLGIFITYHTLQALTGFFFTGDYKRVSLLRLMFDPYPRIFVQQFIVIFGSIFLLFGAGKIFIVIVAAVKLTAELYISRSGYLDALESKLKEEKPAN